ncbi:Flp pilus assembly protein TadD [Rhodovulum imhoffii]|uniref:Flp pilus assembly protein TadD n=1 Tax=Rhodovulum imhoffii TaxID=365340 RepID=A0A2T5BUX9_9RHOB|nr:tetratricopeptide repeat-containing sulfotransferase family protein [Rhodovulum imhoffii]MBK5934917.1 hypothetical protein [Rhodovulum imhoffii]PTN03318.1 Flp pilus assembly protein TadD [Rhodovulum imhoffii]
MLPLNPAAIKRQFNDALRLHKAGRFDQAESAYTALLRAAPQLTEAHVQLARIAQARGNTEAALAHLARARQQKPRETALWIQEADLLARLGDPARARAFLQEAKAARLPARLTVTLQDRLSARGQTRIGTGDADPGEIGALVARLKSGDVAGAEKRARALRKAHPNVALLANIHGTCLRDLGNPEQALAAFRAAIARAPEYAEAHNNLGRVLLNRGEVDAALASFQTALRHAPALPPALCNLGLALARKGRAQEAIAALRKAVAAAPRLREAHLALAQQLMVGHDPEAAETVLHDAREAGHDTAVVRVRLAQALAAQGRDAEAEAAFGAALDLDPESAFAHSARGLFLQTLGRFEDAARDFRAAIALEPENGEHYRVYAATVKFRPGDPLIAEMEALYEKPGLSVASRMHLAFALARAQEAVKAHDKVFPYLVTGNALMRRRYPYDIAARRAEVNGLKAAFSGADLTPSPDAPDFAPIFVTGMPRSGTTLVEQILASHPRVGGAGEVGYFAGAVTGAMAAPKGFLPFADVPDTTLREIAGNLETRLRALSEAGRVTDKSIQTYMVMGAVRKILPRAHIVLVRRDPRDTLFSIYKNMFAEGTHRYAYDLRDLGHYYRLFEEMVGFWRAVLPGGFHEIQYEDLIAAPEVETRKLIAACGLPWEDACLSFHETDRRVSTLSVYQVRQPIYKSSVAAWEHYKDDLAPLFAALNEDGDPDGIE